MISMPTPKRAKDLTLAAIMLLVLSPLMLLIALAIRKDGGPAIFRHRRVGRNGREFDCFKFRTMAVNGDEILARHLESDDSAREEWRIYRKLRRDPRISNVGKILRSTSLDELPQLFNVLKGEMSLVGPRPVTKGELIEHYGFYAECYCSVTPGITGPWQIGGRSDISYDQRVMLDVRYASSNSFVGDIMILARTPAAVISRQGAV